MRPKTKDRAQKITLTLSAPARDFLMREALKRGVSRTQIVEDLVLQQAESFPSLIAEGNSVPQPHNGAGPANILEPSAGGSKTRPIRYQTAREAAKSFK